MNELRAVFWDIDGTIADTEMEGHRIAFNKAFQYYNLKWHWNSLTYSKLLNISGGTRRINSFADSIKQNINETDVISIHKLKQKLYKKEEFGQQKKSQKVKTSLNLI